MWDVVKKKKKDKKKKKWFLAAEETEETYIKQQVLITHSTYQTFAPLVIKKANSRWD